MAAPVFGGGGKGIYAVGKRGALGHKNWPGLGLTGIVEAGVLGWVWGI